MDTVIDHLGETDVAQDDGKEFARHVKREGVDTKHVEERRPPGFLLNVDQIHQESLQKGGEATGNEHVAGTPDALVERQAKREQIAPDDKHRTHHKEGDDLIADSRILTDELTAIEAQKHMGDGGDSAQQSLGIDGTLVIDMIVAKEIQIGLCQHVDAGILSIAVTQHEDSSIDDQKTDDDGDGVLVVAEQGEERNDAVAEGNALHDGPDAQMTETQEVALDGMIEPVDEKADDEEQHRALDDTTDDLRGGLELRLHQREVTRDTHDKKEEGEDEIAGRHAVPLRMAEHIKRFAPAVVDEDHPRHRNATQDIET